MNVGARIKKIRKEQGLSVDELAVLLGKDRATMYRYESNDIKSMPLDILVPISEALGVSPVYIMGLTDDKHFSLSENVYLDDKETEMIMMYRKMNDEGQYKVRDYITELYDGGKYKKSDTNGLDSQGA